MKKLLALLISAAMIFTLATGAFAAPAEVTWEDYQKYLIETAGVNAPDLAEFTAQVEAIHSWDEMDLNAMPWNQFFTTLGLSTWEEFQNGIVKELAVTNDESGGLPAIGESAGGDSPADAAPAGEAPADAAAPAEGESAEGESAEQAAYEMPEYPAFDVDFTPYSNEKGYKVYKVTMTMQAGYQNYSEYEGGGVMTIHSGVGFLDPFGEGYYHAGIMYPEAAVAPEAIYVSDWMDANYGCDLFCIYHTNAGDIFAWDGIYGANSKDLSNYMSGDDALTPEEVNGTTPTRSDNLINIVAGGTGMFKGAYGVLIGTTSGSGIYDTVGALTLPQSLYKYMTGYIVVPETCETAALYEVTQELSEDHSDLQVRSTNYVMVPLTLRMQHGNIEQDTKDGLGTGVLVPFNADNVLVDYVDCPEAANYDVHDYVNDNWLAAYGEPEFMTIHINDGMVSGDVYAYKFSYADILDASSDFAQTGGEKAVFILMVDGSGDFEGITGMLGGFDAISDPEGWGYEFANDLPVQHQTWADGVMKVPAESPAAAYGNIPIVD